jgi:hypothetical protein
MKPAVIFSVPMAKTAGFCWRWRSADGQADSMECFTYYYDCVADARANGYDVQHQKLRDEAAPYGGHA